ncbi:MAG: DUF916 domain-containing protein [Solirubrobacteraceae bacterium]|nr:DUF916 domain-containing protein [Solirubrobacteraceae bacterium]
MSRLLTRALVIAVAAVAAAAAPATAVAAPAIGGISAHPVTLDGRALPDDTAFIAVERPAPSQFTTSIEVSNASDRAIPVRIAAVDTTTSENGGTAFLATDSPRSGAGAWISPGRQALTLGADSTTRLDFKVRVPVGAEPGDHVGGIVIEPVRRVRLDSTADITRIVRVAMAVQVTVPGKASREVGVSRLRFTRDEAGGPPTVSVQLANTGARLCRPALTATFSTDGRVRTSERRRVDTLLPDTAVDYALRWSRKVPDGTYDLQVRTEGCGAPSAVHENLTIDTAGNVRVASATPALEPRVTGRSDTIQLIGLGAVLFAAAATGWSLARRRPRRSAR